MKHHNRQGELQFQLSQYAEMPSYMSVCVFNVDILIPTDFQINLACISFILPILMSLTVLPFLNRYEAS